MSELKEVSDLSNVELLDQYRKDRRPMDELVVAPTINLQKVVKEELLHRLDQLSASQSRERVYREALEEIKELDSRKWLAEDLRGNKHEEIYHVKKIAEAALSGEYDFLADIGYGELVAGWRALTNNKLDEEKE